MFFRLFFLLPKAFFKYGIIINNYLKKKIYNKRNTKKIDLQIRDNG